MRRIATVVAVVALVALMAPAPAYAARGDRPDRHDRSCEAEGNGGGCSAREEEYGDNSCKYVCPAFDDSPVHDAFNFAPVVCLPGSTCNVDRGGDQREEPTPAPAEG